MVIRVACIVLLTAPPVGTGRLGARSFGGVEDERLQRNGDSRWSGRPVADPTRATPADLVRGREILVGGQNAAVDRELMGAFSAGGVVRSHQTMGDLRLTTDRPGGLGFALARSRPADGGRPTVMGGANAELRRLVMRGGLTGSESRLGDRYPALDALRFQYGSCR